MKIRTACALWLKPPSVGEALVEHLLARVAEGRVPHVVREREGLDEVLVHAQSARATVRAIDATSSVCVSRERW